MSAGSVADRRPWDRQLRGSRAAQAPASGAALPREPAAAEPREPAVAGTRRAPAPRTVAGLCEQFAAVCESAVDPLEIASALEFEGLGDQAVRQRYGFPDVFALAQHMYEQVPRQPAEPEEPPDPWHASRLRPALHALLYALPGICFPAAVGLLAGHGVKTTLVVALLAAWSAGQGLAHLGYARLGRTTDADQARRLLRTALAGGLAVVAAALATAALVVHPSASVLAFGAGEGAYMLGAGVVMVLGAERWLLVALAPGAGYSAVFLALGRPPDLAHLAWAMLAATPVLALALAVIVTHPAGPRSGRMFEAGECRGALLAVGFGLTAAGLLSFPVVAGANGRGGAAVGALLAALPLSLSMGAAEWSLLWYRRRTQRLLRTTDRIGQFRAQARLALLAALGSYVAAAAALTAATVAVAAGTGLVRPQLAYLPQLAAYLTLGAAMFLALAALAFGARVFPLAACAVALAAEIALRGFGQAEQIVTSAGLLLAVGGYTAVVLSRAVRHAYY